MTMSLWGIRFPQIAAAETRSITVLDSDRLPAGCYGLVEFYCDEVDCDCRRVIIQVVCETTGPKVWATISYGWEPQEFYGEWMRDQNMEQQINGAFLDPISPQSEYAYEFLDYFLYVLDTDAAYAERLQRHYWMFKASLNRSARESTVRQKRGAWKPPRKGKLRNR